jgi:hypothetical protein
MITTSWMKVLLVLLIVSPALAATKDNEKPDREILRMMDFLRELELMKNIEMMQDLPHVDVEQIRDQTPGATGQKPLPERKKEAVK